MIDDAVLAWFQAHRHPAATQLMLLLSLVHSTAGLLAISALLGMWMAWRRERMGLGLLVASVPGAMLLNVGVKHLFARARPVLDDPIVVLHTYSFPSGHATGSAALYTFLTLWFLSHGREASTGQRAAIVSAAVAMTLMVSLARVYLGVHYPSDVVAGMVLGTSWSWLWSVGVRRQAAKVIR